MNHETIYEHAKRIHELIECLYELERDHGKKFEDFTPEYLIETAKYRLDMLSDYEENPREYYGDPANFHRQRRLLRNFIKKWECVIQAN